MYKILGSSLWWLLEKSVTTYHARMLVTYTPTAGFFFITTQKNALFYLDIYGIVVTLQCRTYSKADDCLLIAGIFYACTLLLQRYCGCYPRVEKLMLSQLPLRYVRQRERTAVFLSIMPKMSNNMAANLIYLNGNNSTLQIVSVHETNKIFSYNGNYILLNQKKSLFLFDYLLNCCTFAMRQFYYHIRIGDFLYPIVSYCLKYKQRFLRTYSPQSRYGTVASWRNSLLSLFINF